MLSYQENAGQFTVSKYTEYTTYKALVGWGLEYSGIYGFYEPPTGCYPNKCTVTNNVRL